MNTHTTTPSDLLMRGDTRARTAPQRFGAIVRTLAEISGRAATPVPQAVLLDPDAVLPTRRLNRMRKLLGPLPSPGKSRMHTRRLR